MSKDRKSKMNKYKMLKELEDGAMATTHLAKNLKKDEKVVIKILKKKYYSLEECNNNKEVQVRQKLNHKNVLKMLDVINDANELLIVLEYMPENIQKVMKKRNAPFSEKETKVLMQQVFQGLSHVHKMGFMHRCLKPEGLMCNEDATEVKIGDFSMARSTLDQVAEYTVTPVWYMAPEVMLGSLTYSTHIDMWAAGCIMAELLSGKPLFPGSDVPDQMKRICLLIGTLTKSEWQDGSQLMRQQIFSLPKVDHSPGLGSVGVEASAEAKGLIMDLLVWNPNRRKTAEQAIRHEFFKSDGDFVNSTENQEILSEAEDRLRGWKDKYQADLTRGSLSEFERILAEISQRHGQNTHRNEFSGFESSNPLLGDSTPRSKFSNSQPAKVGGKGGADDPFGQFRPKKFQSGELPSPRKSQMPFDEEIQSREETRRPRQSTNNKDSLFGMDGPEIGRVDHSQKAERLKQQNPMKYRARYGDDFMRSQLGAKNSDNGQTNVQNNGQLDTDRQQARDPVARSRFESPPQQSVNFDNNGLQQQFGHGELISDNNNDWVNNNNVRNTNTSGNSNTFGGGENNYSGGQGGGPNTNFPVPGNSIGSPGIPKPPARRRWVDDDDKFASIDHTARAERLKQQNYLRFRAKYGDDDMRNMLGGRPSQQNVVNQNSQTYKIGGNDQGNGQYTPSWTENRQTRNS